MKGLELARAYYEEYGAPMLREQFPELVPYLAVGLTGSGSECLGFDDEVSQDHDFEPGFCIFLPGEEVVDRPSAFRLERAYAKLPKEFMGFSRGLMAPVGGNRRGVIRTADYYREKIGVDIAAAGGAEASGEAGGEHAALLGIRDWLRLPSYALREAVSGEIFEDPYGQFTGIRDELLGMPEDVRLKRMAGHVLLMAQAGQYNYPRIIRHGERTAAQMAVYEFVKSTIEVVFLLNNEYTPFYKWSFRAMRDLLVLGDLEPALSELMTTDNEGERARSKAGKIEEIAGRVIEALQDQGLTKAVCGDLEKHAYSINDGIADGEVRNMHILCAV